MANPFVQGIDAFLNAFDPTMRARRTVLSEQAEQLNPLRQDLLQSLTGQQPFAGGPVNEFASMANIPQRVQPMQQPGGVQATPLAPQQPVRSVPMELSPPPEIDQILQGAAAKYGVPVNALRALAAQESSFRPDAVNQPTPGDPTDPGAFGLFQFTEQTARDEGIDPNDPAQAADATARMLRRRLDAGASLGEAMMMHFGGPNPEQWGPKTQRYAQEVADKFQRLEQAVPPGGARGQGSPTQQPAPGMPGSEQLGAGESIGPFGTALGPSPAQQNPVARVLAGYAKDPRAFAEAFASPQGMQQLLGAFGGQGGEAFTLSPGETRFTATGQEIARGEPKPGKDRERISVMSGDNPIGRNLGLQPGERRRVKEVFNEQGNIITRQVLGEGGTTVNIGQQEAGAGAIDKELEAVMETGRTAARMLPSLQRTGELLAQGVDTGIIPRTVMPLRNIAEDLGLSLESVAKPLGIDISGNELADQEEADRLMRQVMIEGMDSFKGNLNQTEIEILQNAYANFGRSEEANKRAVAMTLAAAEMAIERRNEALSARDRASAERVLRFQRGSADEFKRRFEQKLEQFQSRTREAVGQQPQQGQQRVPVEDQGQPVLQAPQPGTVEDGYRFRGGNPADPNNWERVQ